MNKIILSIGSNIGEKKINLNNAINEISNFENSKIEKISNIYETSPVGYKKQDNFFNICIIVKSELDVFYFFEKCQQIEKKLGRIKNFKNGPRLIDIDIIFFNNDNINKNNLIIPHQEWKKRAFVLIPLIEIVDENFYYYNEINRAVKKIDSSQKITLISRL